MPTWTLVVELDLAAHGTPALADGEDAKSPLHILGGSGPQTLRVGKKNVGRRLSTMEFYVFDFASFASNQPSGHLTHQSFRYIMQNVCKYGGANV